MLGDSIRLNEEFIGVFGSLIVFLVLDLRNKFCIRDRSIFLFWEFMICNIIGFSIFSFEYSFSCFFCFSRFI